AIDLHAHTMVYDHLISDRERYYAGLVAEGLGLPIQYLVLDDYALYERWEQPEARTPEPVNFPLAAVSVDLLRQVAAHSRIALTGEGVDAALLGIAPGVTGLLREAGVGGLMRYGRESLVAYHRLPRLGVRTMLRRR